MEFISPYKCIKNTSTNGTVLREHRLKVSRGPRSPKRTRNPHVTGEDERKKKQKRREEVATSWEAPHWQGDQLAQKGSFGGYQKGVQHPVCGRQDRVRPKQMVCATALCAPV